MRLSDPSHRDEAATQLDEILRDGSIRCVLQPIVDLETGALFGFEALARGPDGSLLARPDQLFATARRVNRLAELDAACQQAALASAQAHALRAPLTLFVNAEPDAGGFASLPSTGPGVRGVVELTERTLTSRLTELLPAVQRARAEGWGIALDDVGADTRSLALMPLLRPDVIKLDLRLVQDQPTREIVAIAGAVGAQADRTGATVLAEGVETAEQAQYARALGATLGQGYFFGHPTSEPRREHVTGIPLPIFTAALPHPWRTPFELASARRPVRRGTIPLLASISGELERQAASLRPTCLLISSFPDAEESRARIDTVYAELAAELAFVAALAGDMPARRGPGLRGVRIRDEDPLRGSWNVVVIGPHFASMLAARERSGSISAEASSYDFVFSYDRDVIIECAQALMLRIALAEGREDPSRKAAQSSSS